MDGYLMLKPGWNEEVSNQKLYNPKVWQLIMHLLSLNGISIKIGILTKINESQLKVMYPLYVGTQIFPYLVKFYSRRLSLFLILKANPDNPDCIKHLLSLKKDYNYIGCYTNSLRELRRVRPTPNLTGLAAKLKRGELIKDREEVDLTQELVSAIYGRGAVVHSPSSIEEKNNDLSAILGPHSNFFTTLYNTENRGLFPAIYYLNPVNSKMYPVLTFNESTSFGREHFIIPYFEYSTMREWRGLYKGGIITQAPSDSLNIDDEFESYSAYRGGLFQH